MSVSASLQSRSGGSCAAFFCLCFVLFECPMKLRETAIEQESLQAAFLKQLLPVAMYGPATPHLYKRCSL